MITYVTALIDLYETRPDDKTIEKYVEHFNKLQETGIYFHLFLSPTYKDKIVLKNGLIEYISLEELDTYKNAPQGIPENRNMIKDTRNFMIVINAKTEFVYRAIMSGKHDTDHYAWIDFGISHVFKREDTFLYLKNLKIENKCLYIPGCHVKGKTGFDHINWRFCGGFFIGDKESLLNFHQLHQFIFPTIPKLSWEVNVWAYMENFNWDSGWYLADHNDSIVRLSL